MGGWGRRVGVPKFVPGRDDVEDLVQKPSSISTAECDADGPNLLKQHPIETLYIVRVTRPFHLTVR